MADFLKEGTWGAELLVNFIDKKDIVTNGFKFWASWRLYIEIARDVIILIAEKNVAYLSFFR